LKEKNDLFALIEQNIRRPIRLFVYSWEFDRCREVTIVPDPQWGGGGLLGCDIGFGLIHRIPAVPFNAATREIEEASSLPPRPSQISADGTLKSEAKHMSFNGSGKQDAANLGTQTKGLVSFSELKPVEENTKSAANTSVPLLARQ
jgi:hypothetical protein